MLKETKRKGFNFYRSYYDVFNELNDKDKLLFIESLLNKQFLDIEPENLTGMVKFAWISQYNSIDQQVKGYKSKTKDPMQGGRQGGSVRGEITPTLQEKEKEKEEVELTTPSPSMDLVETNEHIKQIEVIYEIFISEIKEGYHSQWAESAYMSLKIKKGSLTPLLKDFKHQLIKMNKLHKNTLEVRQHFDNWLNKLDSIGKLNQFKLQRTA